MTAPSPPSAVQGSRPSVRHRNLSWRWLETMASPAIVSNPFRAASGDGASGRYPPKSDGSDGLMTDQPAGGGSSATRRKDAVSSSS